MAKSSDHVSLANKSQLALSTLINDHSSHSEWIATVAFYKAIHLVEAACRTLGKKHPHNHNSRLDLLKSRKEIQPIYKHFKHLYVASCIARYLHDKDSDQAYSTFDDYIAPNDVAEVLVNKRLKCIEDELMKYLSEIDKENLARVA